MDPAMAMALMPVMTDPEIQVVATVQLQGDSFKLANFGTILAGSGFIVDDEDGATKYVLETGNTILSVILNPIPEEV